MALSRRTGQRFQASIWPGFVDAMTALLLVLIFVLTIFMVVQSIQNETITGQEDALDRLSGEITTLSRALGAAEQRNAGLEDALATAQSDAEFQARLVEALTQQVETRSAELRGTRAQLLEAEAERDNLSLALAAAREEIDAGAEAARLAAAGRAALEALVADLRSDAAEDETVIAGLREDLSATEDALSDEEAARLAEAAAAEALRDRLDASDAELTAMTLALEEARREAEETLTLLAAAEAAREDLDARLVSALLEDERSEAAIAELQDELAALREAAADEEALRDQLAAALAAREAAEQSQSEALTEVEQRDALLRAARAEVAELDNERAADTRRIVALNAQVAELRAQMGSLQALLDDAEARDAAADIRIETLGTQLNAALARVASEERRRAELEAAERRRLEQEAEQLEQFRSEFFGRLREVLGDQEGVQIEGDRFVFSSEVLFATGVAELSPDGQQEVAQVARVLQEVAALIPPEINWIIRVDGHTDAIPVSAGGRFTDNWELSQARALSVVQYMIDAFGFPPERLAATGFAEFQPVDPADTPEARAQNRRIELKLTEQ